MVCHHSPTKHVHRESRRCLPLPYPGILWTHRCIHGVLGVLGSYLKLSLRPMKNLTVLHDEKNSIMKRLNRNMRRLYGTAVLSVISAVTFIIVWAVVAITLSQLALFLGI